MDEIRPYLGMVAMCKLNRECVKFTHLQYTSEEVVAQLRSSAFRKEYPDGMVKFRYEPENLGQVWVWMPHLKRYLLAPVSSYLKSYAEGLSIWQHKTLLASKLLKTKKAVNVSQLNEAKARLAQKYEDAFERRQKIRSARTYARNAGVGRNSYAGDREETSPVGYSGPRPTGALPTSGASADRGEAWRQIPSDIRDHYGICDED